LHPFESAMEDNAVAEKGEEKEFTKDQLFNAFQVSEDYEPSNPYLILRLPPEMKGWVSEEDFNDQVHHAMEARQSAFNMTGPGEAVLHARLENAQQLLTDPQSRAEFDRRIEERKKDGSVKVLRFDNALYEGGVITGPTGNPMRHGKGVTVCTNGEKYEGEYENGLRVGFGINFWSSGDYYIGQWDSDRMEGNGLYFHQKGSWYLGKFSNGLKHGYGVFQWHHGDVYRGQFEDGYRAGYGAMTFTDGGVYEGQWIDGHEHGQGTFTHPTEGSLSGQWSEGLPSGLCEQHLGNGDLYKGNVNKGVREGEGVYTWAQGDEENPVRIPTKVEGTFKRDLISGKGTFNDPEEGIEYEGSWREHLPDGEGRVSQTMNKSTDASFDYEGGWSKGKRHGHGAATWPNGTKHTGDWHEDLRQGDATVMWETGNAYRGKFDVDERHGLGTFQLHTGEIHHDRYVRGVLQERDDREVLATLVPQSAETTLPPWSAGVQSLAESGEFEKAAVEPPFTPTDGDD